MNSGGSSSSTGVGGGVSGMEISLSTINADLSANMKMSVFVGMMFGSPPCGV